MSNNLKIYITTHLDNTENINNELYTTINIKEIYTILHRIFSEYCAIHYVYHHNLYSDYIGFCHYRRKIMEFQIDPIDNDIQYFYCYNESFPINDNELSYFKYWCTCACLPLSTYEDVNNYLKKQKYISYKKAKEYFNNKEFQLYAKEIFITDYNLFEQLVKFIDDYILFIKSKYDIHSEEDWKQHIINNFIIYHQKFTKQIISHNEYTHHLLYQSKKDFMNIFNNDYGFSSPICNSWRIYSYIIEILISLFIYTHNHHEYILNKDNEHSTFNLLNSQYNYLYHLLNINKPKNICELGSGYSTVLFKKYCHNNTNTNLTYIEHKNNDFNLIEHTSITIGNTQYTDINKYDQLEEYLINLNKKFDFVLIDGPYSYYNYLKYGRIQMLDFVEYNLLSDKGIFIIHDSQRKSTKKTIDIFLNKLTNKNYKYITSFENKDKDKEMMVIQYYK